MNNFSKKKEDNKPILYNLNVWGSVRRCFKRLVWTCGSVQNTLSQSLYSIPGSKPTLTVWNRVQALSKTFWRVCEFSSKVQLNLCNFTFDCLFQDTLGQVNKHLRRGLSPTQRWVHVNFVGNLVYLANYISKVSSYLNGSSPSSVLIFFEGLWHIYCV